MVPLFHASLAELTPGIKAYIIARIARFWNTVLPASTVAVSIEMVLADDKGNAIHAIIPKEAMHHLRGKFAEGEVYKIVRFQVYDRKTSYKCVPGHNVLYFSSSTEFQKIITCGCWDKFPRYCFNFATINEIRARNEREPVLTDAVGLLTTIAPVTRVFVPSRGEDVDERDIYVTLSRISFWENHIHRLDVDALLAMELKPVLAITATTVREYLGKKTLWTTSGILVYVDLDIPQTRDLKEMYKDDKVGVQLHTAEEVDSCHGSTQADQDVAIDRLFYFTPNELRGQRFRVEARVIEVDTTNGWYYECCNKDCNLKAHEEKGGFRCTDHDSRFVMRLSLIIKDVTGSIQVTVFGNLAENLIGVQLTNTMVYGYFVKACKDDLSSSLKGKEPVGVDKQSNPIPITSSNAKYIPVIPPKLAAKLAETHLSPGSPRMPPESSAEDSPAKRIKHSHR
ncbi:Nucleic acid-binding protein [Corchorus olitorius]|uniref:Nucleic acid-binding protein n=1 Tax=Corchorus olitorius TaxID=93759 RepID=A0A1R3J682_9ROSI|nr:Nucleic acid-binding protein [Corchorus olitorius]